MLFYNKKHFLKEFKDEPKIKFILFQLTRIIVFIFDIIIPILITYVVWRETQINKYIKFGIAIIAPYIFFVVYNISCLLLASGQTFGMFIGRMIIVDRSGFKANNVQYFMRALMAGLYSIPIVGWTLIIFNLLYSVFKKGLTVIDLLSKTQPITTRMFKQINNIMEEKNE